MSGKTTLATNFASALSIENPNKRVLIIDMDGQSNAALSFGLNPNELENSMYDVMIEKDTISQIIVPLEHNLFLAPSNDNMNYLEMDLLTDLKTYPNPLGILKKQVEKIQDKFDYIVIDSPPSLGLISGNIFSIENNNLIIPFNPETFSVQGLIRITETVKDFKFNTNPSLKIAGVVGMMVDSRTSLHSELLQQARQYCYSKEINFLDTVIPKSIRFANSTAYNEKPAVFTDNHEIVKRYFEITKELTENEQKNIIESISKTRSEQSTTTTTRAARTTRRSKGRSNH